MNRKVLIISAPSGSGKSTLIGHLLKCFPALEFSISATSRAPRGNEQYGVDYYFLSQEEFSKKVELGEFLEWEEVYNGSCYGTLNSEIERIWSKGNIVVFDVDVVGGTNIKSHFPHNSLSIFIEPPSIEELKLRLYGRGTDSLSDINKRIEKAERELAYRSKFDEVIVNDNLEVAKSKIEQLVKNFINGK